MPGGGVPIPIPAAGGEGCIVEGEMMWSAGRRSSEGATSSGSESESSST